jgi:Flp pilus assembly protein TadG
MTIHRQRAARRGAVVILAALLMVFLIGMVAFAVDLGKIKWVRTELQAAADSAALAGASRLLDRDALMGFGNLVQETAAVRDEAVRFAALNKGGDLYLTLDRNDLNLPDGDIVLGYLENPRDQGSSMQLVTPKPYNSVKVRVHRDTVRNGSLPLLFAPVLGTNTANLSATATATFEVVGVTGFRFPNDATAKSKLLPFALDVETWKKQVIEGRGPDDWSYNPNTGFVQRGSDNIKEVELFPLGLESGNFGTIDIGSANNSTSDIERQILHGPNQADFNHYPGGKFELGPNGVVVTGGDTGISGGMKNSLEAIIGQPRILPLYKSVDGPGNNAEYTIIAFAGIIITDVQLTGNDEDKRIIIQPEWVIDATAVGGKPDVLQVGFAFLVKLQLSR